MDKRKHFVWPLRRKFAVLLLIFFVPCAVGIAIKGIDLRKREIRKAEDHALLLTQSLAAQQEQLSNIAATLLPALAHAREVETLDVEGCNRLFAQIHERYPNFNVIAALRPDGQVFAASRPFPAGLTLADRKHVQDAIGKLDFSVGEYQVGRIVHTVGLSYGYPVLDRDNRLIAVVIAGFGLDQFQDFVSRLHLPNGYAVLIADRNGTRLFRWPRHEMTPQGERMSSVGFNLISSGDEQGLREWKSLDGTTRIYAYKRLRLGADQAPYLYVLTGIPKQEIFRQADSQVLNNLLLLLLGLSTLTLVAWVFSELAIVKPIARLVSATRQFGAGDMNVRTGLFYSADEIGQLAKSFDEAATLLRERDERRCIAENALTKANAELELRVQQRTSELEAFTQKLALHRMLSPLAVIEWNTDFQVADWNPAAERIFGYAHAEAVGRNGLELLVPAQEQGKVWEIWRGLLQGREEAMSCGENLTKDGRTILCEWHNNALVNSSGEVIGVASIVQDITEARQMQQRLLQAQKMEAIGRLAGGVAHDFNNMLMVISSYTELLLSKLSEDTVRPYGQQILGASRRAADLTSQLLAFSRKQSITPRVVDVNAMLTELGKMLPHVIGENIDLVLDLEPELHPCRVDPTHLEQAIMNLVLNARDAMPDGGRLLLRTSNLDLTKSGNSVRDIAPGLYVKLTIKDGGVGIAAEALGHIFEPFYTTKELGKGTGLGLSIVYGAVKQNGGYVFVDSDLGQGTTFELYLPVVESETVDLIAAETACSTPDGAGTVLFVEDEEALRAAGADCLSEYGYRVLVARNGEEALRKMRESIPRVDALVTDIKMPGMTGVQLAQRVRAIVPNVRVFYISGYADGAVARNSGDDSDEIYMEKPFSFRVLAQKLSEALGSGTRK